MAEFRTIDLEGAQLHYAAAPGPGPALVILHGLTGSHAEFLHLVPELTRQAHVYILDLRGHGLSGRRRGAYQIADYERDVAAFLQQVVGRPAVLAGHSLGGIVAAWLAAHRPDLVRALFLAEPGFYIVQRPRFRQSVFYPYFAGLRDYLQAYHATGASLDDMMAYVGQTPVEEGQNWLDVAGPEPVRARAIQLHQLDPAVLEPVLAGTLLNGAGPDELLAQICCPVHILAAEVAVTVQDVERAASHIHHCTYAVIRNSGHDIHLDQPQAFVQTLKQFIIAM